MSRLAFPVGASFLLLLGTACSQLRLPGQGSQGEDGEGTAATTNLAPAPTLVPSRLSGNTVPVRRGSLTQVLTIDGTVEARNQETVTYAGRGTVDEIKVKAGQTVKQGDTLVDFAAGEATSNLKAARDRLATSQAALVQGQAQVAARQQVAEQQTRLAEQQQRTALDAAQAQLARAQENLTRVRAGKSASERAAQQTAVEYGKTQVLRAQQAYDSLVGGPDPAATRAADRDVQNAQLAQQRAQAELDALTTPDPTLLRTAQNNVQRAQTALQVAQAAKVPAGTPDPAAAKLQLDMAVQDAQTTLLAAEAALDKLKGPPPALELSAARQKVSDANDTLAAAQSKQADLANGPTDQQLGTAREGIEYAKHYLAEAQANYAEILSHPTPAELAEANEQVRAAQAAIVNAGQPVAPLADGAGIDLDALQAAIDRDQADIKQLEIALDSTHLRAPFNGTVLAIRVKVGDTVTATKPVLVMAHPGAPVVRLELDETQAGLLTAGQRATIQFDDGGTQIPAIVSVVTTPSATGTTPSGTGTAPSATSASGGGTGAQANLEVSWPEGQLPRPGQMITASITTQEKSDILVVPPNAIRKGVGKTTVEVVDNTLRRLVQVQTGITAKDGVEIVSGLSEGQLVLSTGN
jgi:multidrug efflux pump subunit AcrA (membrane-fusion protein)